VELKENIETAEILERIQQNSLVSSTTKFDSNVIFEQGRRYGHNGRIYSHCIFVPNNLMIDKGNIKGWAFIPQEGNTLISSIHAFILQMNLPNEKEVMDKISHDLINKIW
jgi:glyceraldehyde-3-phosphate dehydrogenase (NAD(P))